MLRAIEWILLGIGSVAAVAAGVRRHRPARVGPWLLLAAAVAVFAIGDVCYVLGERTAADLCYLAMFALVAVALLRLTRGGALLVDRTGLIDLVAFSCSTLLVVWVFVIGGGGRIGQISAADMLGDLLLVGVAARLAVAAGGSWSAILLAVGAVGLLAGDIAYSLAPSPATEWPFAVLYVAWAAAALHPSMARLTEPVPPGPTPWRGRWAALLGLAVATPPTVLLIEAMTGTVEDGVVIAVAGGITLMLAITRLADSVALANRAEARERSLRKASAALVAAADRNAVDEAVRAAIGTLMPPNAISRVVFAGEDRGTVLPDRPDPDADDGSRRGTSGRPPGSSPAGSASAGAAPVGGGPVGGGPGGGSQIPWPRGARSADARPTGSTPRDRSSPSEASLDARPPGPSPADPLSSEPSSPDPVTTGAVPAGAASPAPPTTGARLPDPSVAALSQSSPALATPLSPDSGAAGRVRSWWLNDEPAPFTPTGDHDGTGPDSSDADAVSAGDAGRKFSRKTDDRILLGSRRRSRSLSEGGRSDSGHSRGGSAGGSASSGGRAGDSRASSGRSDGDRRRGAGRKAARSGEATLVCPLWLEPLAVARPHGGVLAVTGRRDLLAAARDTLEVLAGQAALALDRINLVEAVGRRDSDLYLRAVIRNTAEVMLVIDEDQRIRYASPALGALVGRAELDPLATLGDLVHPDDRIQVRQALQNHGDGTIFCALVRPDDTQVLVEATYRDLRLDRLVQGYVVTLRPITGGPDLVEQIPHADHVEELPAWVNRRSAQHKFRY